ncbi:MULTISPECIES: cytochrome c peroxidase [Bradyrhizobium]|uniref:Cytochrome-c peroxidase n=1 Tax=Bradyrhizobium elkanii TaxID=29448 RepID=A0A4U6S3M2_BRAEL|nr:MULTISPECIES: cytochrome c peroxidase [Bradyrhizobium]MTV12523.1 cytochrome-c peroxidase [Bradyrhizobium sp. BR2003]TKV82274.1 cytochrome-c peroxidase [Bradyrhizobium elkanii]
MNGRTLWLLGAALLCMAGTVAAVETQGLPGTNPNPVQLRRPPVAPLSAMALLGQKIFFDASLSSSGALSCASCHSPDHAYGPPNDGPVMLGGPAQSRQGTRAVPGLTYLERQPNFSIGPEKDEDDNVVDFAQLAALGQQAARARKVATGTAASAVNIVPQGGLFWDGRADTLQDQAIFPLLDPNEMDGGSIEIVAQKLRRASYAPRFAELFGAQVFDNTRLLVAEAMFAVARYQVEEPSFHPYTSKFDYWLEGKARLNESELRGLQLFNDPDKANCGGCHTSQPTRDGLPPLFTDHQYEALGAPRNAALAGNRDPDHFDLGVCGPYRTDIAEQTQYCGMFLTPTLRNTATRRVFFHNGVFTSLEQVLDFYNFRDTNPEKVFPRDVDGTVRKYDDLPERYHGNVDVSDPPFERHLGDVPAMTAQDEADIIAFLKTLTDGYQPER